MPSKKVTQDFVDFNKNAVKMSFDALSTFSEQTAKAADQLLETVPNVPEEGKKAVSAFFKENQKGLDSLKSSVEAGLEIDWTSKEAPAKGIDAMENFYNSAVSHASAIQKETKASLKKTTDQLPKEIQPVVEFWNQAINNYFQIFQGLVTRNFDLAKKVLSDESAEAPKAETKAATK